MGILAASITTRVAAANEDVRHSDLQLIDNALNQALTLLICPSSSALMTASNGASSPTFMRHRSPALNLPYSVSCVSCVSCVV